MHSNTADVTSNGTSSKPGTVDLFMSKNANIHTVMAINQLHISNPNFPKHCSHQNSKAELRAKKKNEKKKK